MIRCKQNTHYQKVLFLPEKNLTQIELSQLSGITQADLSKIENGNANPSLNTLLKLAKG